MSMSIHNVSTSSFFRVSKDVTADSISQIRVEPCAVNPSGSDPELSLLSRQLADSAIRAEARDARFDRSQLGVEADRLLNQIFGDVYQSDKTRHNNEQPKTFDAALLERAARATEYVVRSDKHDKTAKNPFEGLSREQLNLIVYDEDGPYTINERRAAFYGVSDIESSWRRELMVRLDVESAANDGRTPRFYTEVLAQYLSLPAIEQAQLPENYEAELIGRIEENGGKRDETVIHTLFEILARLLKYQNAAGLTGGTENEAATSSAFSGADSPQVEMSSASRSIDLTK